MKNLKRLGLLLLAMLLISALSITAFAADAASVQEPVCYNHGDMNSDGIVDNRDAIYTLYCFMLGEDFGYAANQDWDFDADGNKDNKDALYVLYAYMLDGIVDTYQLKGIVHEYYDPTWTWDTTGATVTASVTFKCGCGQTHTIATDDADGVTVTAGTVTAATCVTAGSAEYEAKVIFEGVEYTASTTVTTPAVGAHQMNGIQSCESSAVCSVCGYEMPATGHSWVLNAAQSTEATCTAQAVQVYACATCGQTKQVVLEGTVACQYEYIGDVNTTGCTYVKQYQCKSCQTVINGTAASDTYELHSYTATLTKEATCVSAGEKTYTCSVCGSSYTEAIAANGSHNWVEDGTANGVTSYHCGNEGCSETKTVVSTTSNEAALDNKDALDGNELQLGNGATLELDKDTVDGLESDKQLIISVDEIDADDTNLPDELKAQVGDNVVYDFTMAYTDGQTMTPVTSFGGKITVSLPYQLAEGEDIDSIDVWFINDEGEAEQVFGTYSNGYVTFTTEHFSYYSVTRLTPAQRCERYGHLIVDANKQATCTADGYSMSVCQRCGEQLSKTIIPMTGHSYEETVVAATCTTDGSSKKACTACGHTVSAVVPALGHSMELDASQSVAASCGAAGKNVYICENCDHSAVEELAQLKHQYTLSQSQTADCTNKGFNLYVCSLCGGEDVRNEKAPLGHNYKVSQWNWSSDKLSATLELVCANDASHTHSINAVVTSKASGAACEGQTITYTAAASYNNITYTDTAAGVGEASGHTPSDMWVSNANQHYRECTVCGKKIDSEKHSWDEGTVTVEPTCSTAGTAIYACTICGYEKTEKIPATREHDYVDGICSVCGGVEGENCNHQLVNKEVIDLSAYNVCECKFIQYSCECGKNTYVEPDYWTCEIDEFTETEEETADGYLYKQAGTCSVCGLTIEVGSRQIVDADSCTYYTVNWIDMFMDGKMIVNTEFTSDQDEHPTVLTETIELTKDEYGICGVTIEIYSCYCGEQTRMYTDSQCEFAWYDNVGICAGCGLKIIEESREDIDYGQCQDARLNDYTFYMKDQEIYSYTERIVYESHKYEVMDYELLGESCEDGVTFIFTCADCGDYSEDYYEYHYLYQQECYDLTEYGVCEGYVGKETCACGAESKPVAEISCQMAWENGDDCSWGICSECGVKWYSEWYYTEQDACHDVFNVKYTFSRDGVELLTLHYETLEAEHNYEYEAILEGESCEDGVTIILTCADCGDYSEAYYDNHYTMTQEYHDLTEYGLCGGYIATYSCACGEEADTRIDWYCAWNEVDYDENNSYFFCPDCETDFHISWYGTELEQCRILWDNTYVYSRNGVELLRVDYQNVTDNHNYEITDMYLNEGSETCSDGYTVEYSCENCGDSYSREEDGCGSWEISREEIPDGTFCYKSYLVTRACACGMQNSVNFESDEGYCRFEDFRDEETGKEYVQCMDCGVRLDWVWTQTMIEGTCKVQNVTVNTISRDGEVLLTYTSSRWEPVHRYVATFELYGEDCEDGYRVYYTCLDCGHMYSTGSDSHVKHPVSWEEAPDGIFCDKAYLVTSNCACGVSEYKQIEWQTGGCEFEWVWNEETETDQIQCVKCGLVKVEGIESVLVEGSCGYQDTYTCIYYRDGEEVFRFSYSYRHDKHETLYKSELFGQTCEDGYFVTEYCVNCDWQSNTLEEYRHYTYPVSSEEVTGLCGPAKLVTYSCACGQYGSVELEATGDQYCSWESYWDQAAGEWFQRCTVCGVHRKFQTETVRGETLCQQLYIQTVTFVRGSEVIVSYESIERRYKHAYEHTFELYGETCMDGYRAFGICKYCDSSYSQSGTGCNNYVVTLDELPEGVFCGDGWLATSRCACGANSDTYLRWIDDNECSFEWEWDGDVDYQQCSVCHLRKDIVTTTVPSEVDCQSYKINEYTFSRNGEVLFTYTDVDEMWEHQNIHTFELEGELCEDGYRVTETCVNCGAVDTYYNYGGSCWTRPIAYEDVPDGIFCGDAQLVIASCACGRETDKYITNEGCESWSREYDETLDQWVYRCEGCGTVQAESRTEHPIEGACEFVVTVVYTYYRDGEAVYSYETSETCWAHDYICSYEMFGETCEDGYIVYETCIRCGETGYYSDNEHGKRRVSCEDIAEGIFCGNPSLVSYSCACGLYTSQSVEGEDCSWQYTYDENFGKYLYVCANCGVIQNSEDTYVLDRENCKEYQYFRTEYIRDGEVVLVVEDYDWQEYHTPVATFELLGETCDDGYYITYTCHCGYIEGTELDYGCDNRYTIERIYLNTYGMCGGYLAVTSCPCGDNLWWNYDSDCDYEWIEDTGDENDQWYCADCNTYVILDSDYEYEKESCAYVGEWIFRIVRDGETLLDRTGTLRQPNHDYQVVNAELQGESCEDGVTLYFECTVCGRSQTSETSYHYDYVVNTVDLGELGTCGGTVKNYSCACGYDSYTDVSYSCYTSYVSSWNETDENGVDHKFTLYRCSDCGLERMREEYTVYPEGSCTGTKYDIYTYIVDGTVVAERNSSWSVTNHSYEYSYALAEGATVCSDGVVETYTCSVCGVSGSYTRYYSCSSNMIERERIDLSEYGSVCGGYLAHSTCVCGQREKYDRVDMECDLDWNYIDKWIDDCVSGTYYTTEGHQYLSNDFYVMKCAVTDPACGLTIRYAKYWKLEGCEAVQYETWQLGYDEETGTCLKEITYATGNRRTYHAYEHTYTEETLDNGTLVEIDSYVCPNCASSYVQKYYYYDGYYFKSEKEAVNTLDNGEKQYWYYTQEHVEFRENYYDTSLEYTKYVYADGSEYWTRYEYTYSESGCICTTVYTNSNGETDTYESTNHSNNWYYETLKESTCTQFGEYREYAVCKYCGETTYDDTYSDYPNGHNWWWDSEKQIYYCYTCGLENANGADGDIVLEDLTTEDGTDYVVGYWNSADVIFTTYLSVILEEVGEDVDNQLLLSDIEIRMLTLETDGVTAVAFDQAATLEAAATAVANAGYTGSYAIRISFVPANSDTTLDYSITFDSITAE